MFEQMDSPLETTLRGLFVFSLITAFMSGPAVSIGPLDLIMFDLVWVFLALTLAGYLINNPEITIPRQRPLGVFSAAYFGLAFALPVAGLIVYDNPIGYFVGDLRWLQVFVVGLAMLTLYSQSISGLVYGLELAMKIILACNFLMFSIQFLDANNIIETQKYLDIWYYGGPALGSNGYHINRYAGATRTSSGLGLTAATAIAIFGRSALINRYGISYLILAVMLLLASGHRTSMVAVIGIGGVFILYIMINEPLSRSLQKFGFVIAGLVILFPFLYWFDIGRIATSDRYSEMIAVLLSPSLFLEISGRGGRWDAVLTRAENYPMGTLSNPSWVFNNLSVIDSYFVITYLQGGFLFLVVYILFLSVLLIVSLRLFIHSNYAILSVSFTGTMVAFSLTQNFMTSITAKTIAILSVVVVLLIYRRYTVRIGENMIKKLD